MFLLLFCCLQVGWRKWILEKPGVLSARQFVSLCELLSPRARGGGWDEIAMEAELAEVWLLLGRHAEVKAGEGSGSRKRRRKVEEGVTLDMVDRWWRKTKHLTVRSSLKRSSKKVTLSQRQQEAVRRAGKRALVRWRRQEGGRRLGLRNLLQKEWSNQRQGLLSGEQLVAILCSINRKEKTEVAKKEDEEMREQRQDYLDYLETEVEVIEEKVKAKVETEEQKVQEGENEDECEEADYSNDEAVLNYIREKERNKRGISSQVWTAASIALLLRARSQAQLRRKEWEEWAVERHGSLQAAYSNPRVKVPKVEELLVEEWGGLKPTQAGMSAYSLHSYLKRFDTLKAELVGAQEEVRRRKEALRAPPPIQYQTLPQSDIPRSVIHFASFQSHSKLTFLPCHSCQLNTHLNLGQV